MRSTDPRDAFASGAQFTSRSQVERAFKALAPLSDDEHSLAMHENPTATLRALQVICKEHGSRCRYVRITAPKLPSNAVWWARSG